jgi:hypothetical protein
MWRLSDPIEQSLDGVSNEDDLHLITMRPRE